MLVFVTNSHKKKHEDSKHTDTGFSSWAFPLLSNRRPKPQLPYVFPLLSPQTGAVSILSRPRGLRGLNYLGVHLATASTNTNTGVSISREVPVGSFTEVPFFFENRFAISIQAISVFVGSLFLGMDGNGQFSLWIVAPENTKRVEINLRKIPASDDKSDSARSVLLLRFLSSTLTPWVLIAGFLPQFARLKSFP